MLSINVFVFEAFKSVNQSKCIGREAFSVPIQFFFPVTDPHMSRCLIFSKVCCMSPSCSPSSLMYKVSLQISVADLAAVRNLSTPLWIIATAYIALTQYLRNPGRDSLLTAPDLSISSIVFGSVLSELFEFCFKFNTGRLFNFIEKLFWELRAIIMIVALLSFFNLNLSSSWICSGIGPL